AKRTRSPSVDRKAQLIILKRAMDFHLSLPNSLQITLLKLTEVRPREEYCSNTKLFIFPIFWPIPNTLLGRRQLATFVPFLASHCCEKECQLALSFWHETRSAHSPISKSSWSRPLPTKP